MLVGIESMTVRAMQEICESDVIAAGAVSMASDEDNVVFLEVEGLWSTIPRGMYSAP